MSGSELCSQAMKTREDFDEDMQVLWHIMDKGTKNNKKAVDVMLVKIRELNNGTFIGRAHTSAVLNCSRQFQAKTCWTQKSRTLPGSTIWTTSSCTD